MANIKIAQLTAKTTVSDTDILIIEDATQTYKLTFADLMKAMSLVKQKNYYSNVVADLDNFYNTCSVGMPDKTQYTACVQHAIAHPILGGGTWWLEGFKFTDTYEVQEVKTYIVGGIRYFVRSKNNGTWGSFVAK